MAEPAAVLTAAVAAAASLPLVPVALRAAVRVVGRVAAWCGRPGPVTALVVAATLARPAVATAVTPPPLLRVPLPPAAGDVAPPPVGAVSLPQSVDRYVVVPGDSLWAITARHLRAATGSDAPVAEVDREWRRLYERNRDVVGPDPDLIFPGQQLDLPEEW